MKRFPAFDPPEYVDWKPDLKLVKAFRATIENDPERASIVSALTPDAKLQLYRGLLRARLHDVELKRWVHPAAKGWYSGLPKSAPGSSTSFTASWTRCRKSARSEDSV